MHAAKLIDNVAAGHLTAAVECLQEGSDPNALSSDGATAMHIAAGVGVESVRLMLAHGGNPNVRSVDGSTPLHVAAAWGDKDTLRLLLHNGADPALVDQEGQRAIDVARSEHHAACVDFLKYYTMLVAIGDEEEGPMYTTEPLDPSHLDLLASDPLPSLDHLTFGDSSEDDADPVRLSEEYSEALSRRLSKLLSEGSVACLDVTSPECPYIADKQARKGISCDRTILPEKGYCDLDSSHGEDADSCQFLPERQSGCRCGYCGNIYHGRDLGESSHYCRSRKKQAFSDSSHMDRCLSPDQHDSHSCYAREVEQRMKKKYFPGLNDGRGCRDRERDAACGHRSPDSSASCGLSCLTPPQQGKPCCHGGVRSLSPCRRRSDHHSPSCCRVGACDEDTGRCGHHHHSEDSGLASHQHRALTSAQRQQYVARRQEVLPEACSTRQRSLAELFSSTVGRRCSHSPSRSRPCCSGGRLDCSLTSPQKVQTFKSQKSSHQHQSVTNPQKTSKHFHSPLSHLKSPKLGHSRGDNLEGSPSHTSQQRQTARHPVSGSEPPSHGPKSPVTIMPVLGGPRTPVTNVIHRYGVDPPITDIEGKKQMEAQGGGRDAQVSGSGHSVDSGYCEKLAGSRKTHVAETDSPKAYVDTKPWKGTRSPSAFSLSPSSKLIKKEKDDFPLNRDRSAGPHARTQYSPSVFSGKHEADGTHIISSNLKLNINESDRGYKKVAGSVVEKSSPETRTCEDRGTPVKDLSASSADTFCTCEEASNSEPEMNIDNPLPEGKAKSPSLWKDRAARSQHSDVKNSQKNPRDTASSRLDKSKQTDMPGPVFNKKTGTLFKRTSFGFNVSDFDESHIGFGEDDMLSYTNGAMSDSRDGSKREAACNIAEQQEINGKGNQVDGSSGSPVRCATSSNEILATGNILGRLKSHSSHPPANMDSSKTASRSKFWLPPSNQIVDDGNLLTSDESFLSRPEDRNAIQPRIKSKSSSVSQWLQNIPFTTEKSTQREMPPPSGKVRKIPAKRVSDESVVSVASSVQEKIYRDKENGITLIERYIPSNYSGSSGRPSIESAVSLDTDGTISYDWADFVINDSDIESSSSVFAITEGHTLKSEESLTEKGSVNHKFKNRKKKLNGYQKREIRKDTRVDDDRVVISIDDDEDDDVGDDGSVDDDKEVNDDDSGTKDSCTPSSVASLSNEELYQSLKDLGDDPGPVLPSTRQTYLQRLADLITGKAQLALSSTGPGYSGELSRLLSGSLDLEELSAVEQVMVAAFQTPGERAWREGNIKACFNYLLLDPRVTHNLPLRANTMGCTDALKTFLSAVFYIGKGKRSRPYCHLYEAISQLKNPKPKKSKKVERILDIWSADMGVVSLHCFQNVIPVEAYTREACMVDAMGLCCLTNMKKGDYYGVASTWPATRRRCVGAYLLQKAFQIFLSEGERQICPLDIKKGQ